MQPPHLSFACSLAMKYIKETIVITAKRFMVKNQCFVCDECSCAANKIRLCAVMISDRKNVLFEAHGAGANAEVFGVKY